MVNAVRPVLVALPVLGFTGSIPVLAADDPEPCKSVKI